MFMSRRELDDYYSDMVETGIVWEGKPYDLVHPFQMPSFNGELGIEEHQGFRSIYVIREERLLIDKIQIVLPKDEAYPEILGKKPARGYDILEGFTMLWGTGRGMVYENLDFHASITGSLLVGADADEQALMTPDFGASNVYFCYQKLFLLEFTNGVLTKEKDVSGMEKDEFQEISLLARQVTKT